MPANDNADDLRAELAALSARLERLERSSGAQRPLSKSELDGIASRVFQKLRVNVLRVFALTRREEQQPKAAQVQSTRVDPADIEYVLARRRRKGV